MRSRSALLLPLAAAALAVAGCGGGDKFDTDQAQATLRLEVPSFTTVLPRHVNHRVTVLECPGEAKDGEAFTCDIRLSDGLSGTVRVIATEAGEVDWTTRLRGGGQAVTSSH
jgi:hypothetical protein